METTKSKFARRYDREFKDNTVAPVRGGKSITEVAGDLGVSTACRFYISGKRERGELHRRVN